MKYIISLFVIFSSVFLMFINKGDNNMEMNDLKSFSFFYTTGYAMNADVRYEVDCNDKCIAKIKLNGVEEDKAIKKELSSNDISKLLNIIEKNKVAKWNGFNKSDKNVLDGNSFSLSIVFKDKSISASGYMKWPNNYREFKSETDEFFMKVVN